jgi:dGTPase
MPSGGPATFDELDRRLDLRQKDPFAMVQPMTREGCVVRLSDSISYVGRDLEDAILLGFVSRDEIPDDVAGTLGSTCGTIVYGLVDDLIRTSRESSGLVAFSKEKGEALIALKNFNRERIYYNPEIKRDQTKLKRLFGIFSTCSQTTSKNREALPS